MSGCQEAVLIDFGDCEPLPTSGPSIMDMEVTDYQTCDIPISVVHDLVDVPKPLMNIKPPEVNNSIHATEKSACRDEKERKDSVTELIDETFDFDLLSTPEPCSDSSQTEEHDADDDEEVFFGPVSFKERCVRTVVSSLTKDTKSASPLNDQQMAEIFREANAVVNRISAAGSSSKSKKGQRETRANLKQQLFKTEAITSLLKSASASKTRVDNKGSCDKENVPSDRSVEIDSGKLDALTNLPLKFRNENCLMEISNESSVSAIDASDCARTKKATENVLIDIENNIEPEPICYSHLSAKKLSENNSETNDRTTSLVDRSKRTKPAKSKENLLIVLSDLEDDAEESIIAKPTYDTENVKSKENLLVDIGGVGESGEMGISTKRMASDSNVHTNNKNTKRRSLKMPENHKITQPDHSKVENHKSSVILETTADDDADTPSKRHIRSGTYTLSTTQLLPSNKRRSLPVVAPNNSKLPAAETGSGFSRKDGTRQSFSRLRPPSKVSVPEEAKPTSSESLSTSTSSSKGTTKSRLSMPKATNPPLSMMRSSITAPVSKPSITRSASMRVNPSSGAKSSNLLGLRSQAGPISKLQLLKGPGSRLQAPAGLSGKKQPISEQKKGPLKAFAPISTQEKKTEDHKKITPNKAKPRNLSNNFSTPTKSGSTSSMDSPARTVNKRRSFLPTPNKTRLSSVGSVPSPSGSRTSSTSSMRSLDSPGTTTRSASKLCRIDLIDDSSPSSMKGKVQLVGNTPTLVRKRPLSRWSPLQRSKPHDPSDQAIMCTKKPKMFK